MVRSVVVSVTFVLLSVLPPSVVSAAKSGTQPRCEAPSAPGDRRDIACKFSVSAAPRQVRFTANFSGSHDDTMASMTATLDGAVLACDAGSKTDLMGEDGDVSLHCRFTLVAQAGAERVLNVALAWRHAQYTGFELEAD
jgi:hypothetical protein